MESDEVNDESNKLVAFAREAKTLDDFIKFRRYFVAFLVAAEMLALAGLSSMTFMMFAGIAPEVVSCGAERYNSSGEACAALDARRLLNSTSLSLCDPELKYEFYSVTAEFGYLCSDSKVAKNSISFQMAAVLVGACAAGQFSDLYGRRFTLLISLTGMAIATFASAFTNSMTAFTAARMANGFFTGGISACDGVYVMENTPKKHRMLVRSIVTFSPNIIIFSIIAYYAHTWRALSFIAAGLAGVAASGVWLMYESPHFLLQKGRIEEARQIIQKIRRIDGSNDEDEDKEIELMLQHEQNLFEARKQKKYTFVHLAYTSKMLRWTLILAFGICITSLMNYGIMFNIEKLSGSLYLNSIFFGIIRWTMNITAGTLDFSVKTMGRKVLNFFAVSFNAVCLFTITAVMFGGYGTSLASVVRACSIAASAMCAQVYLAKVMTTTELYPTAVRNIAASSLSMSSRLGTIFGPQLFYLADYHPASPYLVLAILAVIDVIAFQVLIPETKGRSLENQLPPKEQSLLYRKRNATHK